jgi:hypothetical protein
MLCSHCGEDSAKFRTRKFSQLEHNYAVCPRCGKAQRCPASLKKLRRGTKPTERDRLWKTLSVGRAKFKFKILVWGPNPLAGTPAAEKRQEIKGELQKSGHEIFFSEDLTIPGVPVNLQELLQVQKAHLVINIATSYGSLAEFENYALTLAERLLVFLNETVRGGFTDSGVRRMFRTAGGTDEFFDDEDLKSCVLVLAAHDWVREKQDLEVYLDAQQQAARKKSLFSR